MTLYEEIGTDPGASPAEIKRAYHRVAQRCHPDKFPGDEAAAAQFRRCSAAYEVLSDPARRAHYDAQLQEDDQEVINKVGKLGALAGHLFAKAADRTPLGRALRQGARAIGVDYEKLMQAEGEKAARHLAERASAAAKKDDP